MALKNRVEELYEFVGDLTCLVNNIGDGDALDDLFMLSELCQDCIKTRAQCSCEYPVFIVDNSD